METLSVHETIQLLSPPSGPLAIGIINGQWIAMRIEMFDRHRIFLMSHSYVRPRSVFELLICLSVDESPVRVLATVSYVERTWNGFGLGIVISTISAGDLMRWERFYRQAAAAETPGYRDTMDLRQTAFSPTAVVIAMALSEKTMDGLQKSGLAIKHVQSEKAAMERIEEGGIQMVIAELDGARYNGADLCRKLSQCIPPLITVLLTDRAVAKDFEVSLYSGASMIVGRPCGQEMLSIRLLEALRRGARSIEATQAEADEMELRASGKADLPRRSRLQQLSAWLAIWVFGSREARDLAPPRQAANGG